MSTYFSQLQAQIENQTTSVESLCMYRKTTASISSISLDQIPTFGSPLSSKLNSSIQLYFENINRLSTDIKLQKYNWKYKKLPYLQRRFNVDIILIIETQIQPALLDNTYDIPSKLFAHEAHIIKLSNNSNELIAIHQQGGFLTSVHGECCKLVTNTSYYPNGLARWQSFDLANCNRKIYFITAYKGISSK